jgi:hypothetical protein
VHLGLCDADITRKEVESLLGTMMGPPFWMHWPLAPQLDHKGFEDDRGDRSFVNMVLPAGNWKLVAVFYRQGQTDDDHSGIVVEDLSITSLYAFEHNLANERSREGNRIWIKIAGQPDRFTVTIHPGQFLPE